MIKGLAKGLTRSLNSRIELVLSVILLCLLFLVLIYRVIARSLTSLLSYFDISFVFPSFWTQELSGLLFINLGLLAISLGISEGLHVRVGFVISRFSPKVQNIVEIIQLILIFFVLCIIAKYGWEFALKKAGQDMESLPLPKFWTYAPLPIISILMNIRIVGRIYGCLTHFSEPIFKDSEDTIL